MFVGMAVHALLEIKAVPHCGEKPVLVILEVSSSHHPVPGRGAQLLAKWRKLLELMEDFQGSAQHT